MSDQSRSEETKRQIRALAEEIAQLEKAGLAPREYFTEFLKRVVQALAAGGGAIWTTLDGRGFELACEINLQSTGIVGEPVVEEWHHQVLRLVQTSGEGLLVAPHSGAGNDSEAGNPTDFLLVLAPLK